MDQLRDLYKRSTAITGIFKKDSDVKNKENKVHVKRGIYYNTTTAE